MGEDNQDGLWLDETPADLLAWEEAERRARDRACGIYYFAEGYLTCPMWWVNAVLAVMHSPQQMAVGLLLYGHIRADRFAPVPNRMFEALRITRKRKYRALALLEDAGLIEVERANGCTPRVRLVLPNLGHPWDTCQGPLIREESK